MFRLTLARCLGSAVLLLGMAVCVCPLPADEEAAAIERLIKALEDKSPDVREAAALALLKQGAKAKAALPALKKALKDDETNVREAAARAVLVIDEARTREDLLRRRGDLLRRLKDTKSPAEERLKACRELARNHSDDESVLTALEAMLSDPDVKELAAAALGYDRARKGTGPALVRTIKGDGRGLCRVLFSPDGEALITADYRTVKLWDALTGQERFSVERYGGLEAAIALSPDGRTLVGGSKDYSRVYWKCEEGV